MKVPSHLAGHQATHEKPGEIIAQFEIGTYKNFVYLILDWEQKKAAIIDPQADLTLPLQCIEKFSFELTGIFLTHTHFDHIAGVPQLVQKFPKIPVFLHASDQHRLPKEVLAQASPRLLQDGEKVLVGGISVEVIHTPGHSAGECSYFIAGKVPYILTGDTLFIQDCGRTDLETGSNDEMFESLQKLRKLPPNSVVLPGHHYRSECAALLGHEIKTSPPFQCHTVEELAQLA